MKAKIVTHKKTQRLGIAVKATLKNKKVILVFDNTNFTGNFNGLPFMFKTYKQMNEQFRTIATTK